MTNLFCAEQLILKASGLIATTNLAQIGSVVIRHNVKT